MHSFPSSHHRSKRLRCFPFANALSRGVSVIFASGLGRVWRIRSPICLTPATQGTETSKGGRAGAQDRGGYAPSDHEALGIPPRHDSVLLPTQGTQGTLRQWGHSPWTLNSALTSPPLHTAVTLQFSFPKAKKVYWSEEAKQSPRAQSMLLLQTRRNCTKAGLLGSGTWVCLCVLCTGPSTGHTGRALPREGNQTLQEPRALHWGLWTGFRGQSHCPQHLFNTRPPC